MRICFLMYSKYLWILETLQLNSTYLFDSITHVPGCVCFTLELSLFRYMVSLIFYSLDLRKVIVNSKCSPLMLISHFLCRQETTQISCAAWRSIYLRVQFSPMGSLRPWENTSPFSPWVYKQFFPVMTNLCLLQSCCHNKTYRTLFPPKNPLEYRKSKYDHDCRFLLWNLSNYRRAVNLFNFKSNIMVTEPLTLFFFKPSTYEDPHIHACASYSYEHWAGLTNFEIDKVL